MQLMKAFVAKMSCNQLLIDSATYLLTINLPTLKSVAMSLYNLIWKTKIPQKKCHKVKDIKGQRLKHYFEALLTQAYNIFSTW